MLQNLLFVFVRWLSMSYAQTRTDGDFLPENMFSSTSTLALDRQYTEWGRRRRLWVVLYVLCVLNCGFTFICTLLATIQQYSEIEWTKWILHAVAVAVIAIRNWFSLRFAILFIFSPTNYHRLTFRLQSITLLQAFSLKWSLLLLVHVQNKYLAICWKSVYWRPPVDQITNKDVYMVYRIASPSTSFTCSHCLRPTIIVLEPIKSANRMSLSLSLWNCWAGGILYKLFFSFESHKRSIVTIRSERSGSRNQNTRRHRQCPVKISDSEFNESLWLNKKHETKSSAWAVHPSKLNSERPLSVNPAKSDCRQWCHVTMTIVFVE